MNNLSKIFHEKNSLFDLCMDLQDKKTVLISGHFNVIHPGHKRFVEYAKSHGKQLVIALQSDEFLLKKNTNERYFLESERANSIASLSEVDYVIILNEMSLITLISQLKPDFYVLGSEFRNGLFKEVEVYVNKAKEVGSKVLYHSGEIHYSTALLLKSNVELLSEKNIIEFKNACNRQNINLNHLINNQDILSNTNILVIGDSIVDQFIACDPLGMSSEAPVLALKEIDRKEFIGGAAIVASHVSALGVNTFFLSITGDDEAGRFIQREHEKNNIKSFIFLDHERPTTFKIRYMVEAQKMLRVSKLEEKNISPILETEIISALEKIIPDMDGIVVSDFVYGVITPNILKAIVKIAKHNRVKLFGDIQCSSQTGNLLKFKNFSTLTPTEREVRIALVDKDSGIEHLAKQIIAELELDNLIITLGAEGLIVYEKKENTIISEHFPSLIANPIDVAGAGDAFLATLSLNICIGKTVMEAAAIGTCAAAISVSRLGNISISANEIKNYILNIK